MADKKRCLDVWILDMNRVYREVPFAVVTDWLQQGRLLPEDKVRLAGRNTWHLLSQVPALAPFLPQLQALAVEDTAEALEPVDLGFAPTRRLEDEDEDVDMIPLIDISLVLLIFFMMTATVTSGFLSTIDTPGARHQLATAAANSFWVGIDSKSGGGQVEKGLGGKALPWFSLGNEKQELARPALQFSDALDALAAGLGSRGGDVDIRLRADRGLPIETIKGAALELHALEDRLNRQRDQKEKLRFVITGEVSEPP
jgi:biopolymer transport protein ExbD